MRSHHRSFGEKAGGALMLTGLAHLPSFPPAPPAPSPFVGREQEQAQALSLLRQRGVVAISGGAGSGKTALAAALVEASGTASFHIELSTGLNDHVESFLWQIARPLAHEAPAIWRALHQIEQARWGYPPVVRLQMILDAYAQRSSQMIIWIDRIEKTAEPALASLIEGLCDYVAHTHRTQIQLILEGRSLPYRLQAHAIPALQGLASEAIATWAQQLALPLSLDEAARVYHQTGGLPQAVAVLLTVLRDASDRTVIERAVSRPELRRFVTHVLSPLSAGEQILLAQIAADPEQWHPLTPDAVLELERLEDMQLVTVAPNSVKAHPLIQHFYQHYTPRK